MWVSYMCRNGELLAPFFCLLGSRGLFGGDQSQIIIKKAYLRTI